MFLKFDVKHRIDFNVEQITCVAMKSWIAWKKLLLFWPKWIIWIALCYHMKDQFTGMIAAW